MSQAGLRIIFVGGWGGESRLDDEIVRVHVAALADVLPSERGLGPLLDSAISPTKAKR